MVFLALRRGGGGGVNFGPKWHYVINELPPVWNQFRTGSEQILADLGFGQFLATYFKNLATFHSSLLEILSKAKLELKDKIKGNLCIFTVLVNLQLNLHFSASISLDHFGFENASNITLRDILHL